MTLLQCYIQLIITLIFNKKRERIYERFCAYFTHLKTSECKFPLLEANFILTGFLF